MASLCIYDAVQICRFSIKMLPQRRPCCRPYIIEASASGIGDSGFGSVQAWKPRSNIVSLSPRRSARRSLHRWPLLFHSYMLDRYVCWTAERSKSYTKQPTITWTTQLVKEKHMSGLSWQIWIAIVCVELSGELKLALPGTDLLKYIRMVWVDDLKGAAQRISWFSLRPCWNFSLCKVIQKLLNNFFITNIKIQNQP